MMIEQTKQHNIACHCGTALDVTNKPLVITCPDCGRDYALENPKLFLLGVQEETFSGVVIT